MDVQRNFFIFSFLFISFLLWQAWQNQLIDNKINKTNFTFDFINEKKEKNQIFVKTDVLNLVINMNGGDIEEASLLAYKNKLKSSKPFKLLETGSNFVYQAQSGLIGKDGPDSTSNNERPLYFCKKRFFELKNNEKELHVPIKWIGKNGVIYIKNFIFKSGQYNIKVEYSIFNKTDKSLQLNSFGQLKQTINLPKNRDSDSENFAFENSRGTAYSTIDNKYEKYKFDSIADNKNLYITTKNGWIAMLQKYFTAAWIPKNTGDNIIYTSYAKNNVAVIGYKSSLITVPPHSNRTIKSVLWIGPNIQQDMALVAPNLDLTVDYGWLWFLSQPLFKLLKFLYNWIGNWGYSIILITFIMKAVTYPLTKAQHISMLRMRSLQPEIHKIKTQFQDDKKRTSQEIMLLYKREKINPINGFLPILIQMPIFLSLYYVLIGSVELRHAPFLLWINDLSSQDPYYVLPIIMGLTMFFIQKTSSTSRTIEDPLQSKIMNFIPVIFTGFFLWLPAGLVLYYIVGNLVTIFQQKFIFSKKIIIN
ncbi:membrane protein insertase YidC [Buchnera aphidicola (Muscaphis stroyani)]|uniref:Membrane protein insertase YidC n=1 Tax=Buchnera aphidicola (Muscaphis stroyani) TaxID=1241869 RepID=A0A4D6YE34_9GAMM|nr:membrane protein insertase YidC [Buchnera aphidicola]QCI24138.1 membrane protein insertase YidC [Buchnera aphidicola (Muscaphis stroyani)]